MERRYINIDDLAEYLSLTKGTLYVWVFQKRIPHFKIGGALRFDLREIENWLKDKRVEELS